MRRNLWILSLVAGLTFAWPSGVPAQQSSADEQQKLNGVLSYIEHFVVRRVVEAVGVEAGRLDSFERDPDAGPETWTVAGTVAILDFTGNRDEHSYRARLAVLCGAYDRAGCWDLTTLTLGQWTFSETSSTIATMADLSGSSSSATQAAGRTDGAAQPQTPAETDTAGEGQVLLAADNAGTAGTAGTVGGGGGQDVASLREAVQQGDPGARYELAEKFRVGVEVEQDTDQALELYRQSAAQGFVASQFRLGELYEEGNLLERDLGEAVKFYRRAAEQGHAGAQYALAHIYHLGSGVAQDMATAIVWYHKAAQQGDEWSQLALGDQYRIGLAVPRDLVQSTNWYRRAAERGNIFAQYELGNAYRYGNGVEVSIPQAMKWYRSSAEAGNPSAKLALSELETNDGNVASVVVQAPGSEVQQDLGSEELVSAETPAGASEADLGYTESVVELGETDQAKLLLPELDDASSGGAPETEVAFATAPPYSDEDAFSQLLARADEQLARLALTTPAGDNAYETYQRILTVQPDNPAALAGIQSVGVKYVELAERARAGGRIERARRYADKALELAPDHPDAQAVDAALRAQEPTAENTAPRAASVAVVGAASATGNAATGNAATGNAATGNAATGSVPSAGAADGGEIAVSALTGLPGTTGASETATIGGSQAPKPELLASGLLYAVSGLDAHQIGDYEEAIKFYSLAISSGDLPDKSLAYVHNNRGASYRNLNRYNEAIEDYDAAIRLNPEYATAFYNRGIAYDRKGFHGLAIDDFDTAVRLNPDLSDAYNQRGIAYVRDGRYDIAIENFSEAIRLDPELDSAYFNRGLAYQSKGDAGRAAEDIKKSYALNPDNPAYGEKMRELGIL